MSKLNYDLKTENLPQSQLKMIFEVGPEEMEKFATAAMQKLASQIKVDGFRKGKIPPEVIEKEIGQEGIMAETVDTAARKVFVDALTKENIQAIGQPKIEPTEEATKDGKFNFIATVDILPAVKLKPWEKQIQKVNQKFQGKKIEPKEEEIQKELDFLANQRAKIVTVNREAKKGDQVEVDFEVIKDNVPIEGGTAKKHPVIIGENKFIPGFEDQLIGAKAAEEKEFNLKFPKDYHAKHLADQDVLFKVKIHTVQERQAPELNDEFAKEINEKFKELKDLKEDIKKAIEHEKQHQQKDKHQNELMGEVVKQTDFEVPESLIEREIDRMMAELEQDLARMGLTKEAHLQQINQSEEKLKEEWKKQSAPNRVKSALVLRHFAQENKLDPDSEEIEKQANQMMQMYQMMGQRKADGEELDAQHFYEVAKGQLRNQKVLEWLTSL